MADNTQEQSLSQPRVTLPQGTFIGTLQQGQYPNTVESFRGVPYALPPTGDRRFRPPVPVGKSANTYDATRFGPRAPARQFVVVGPDLEQSEDCLTANIFRPALKDQSGLLPVALYMHGGAFNRGNAAMHDTEAMVGWSDTPFIGVSFGYRIGALGFLPSKMSADEDLLNLGLRDQICLTEWVQKNIHLFGGDRNNVTLFGLSAGAHSIGHHLLNYEEGIKPLFHRVVMESGAPTSRAVRYPDAPIHEQRFTDFLEEVKCPEGLSSSETFSFLRSLPTLTISEAQATVFAKYNPSLCWAFQPVIDGKIIRKRPIDAWRDGSWHKVPILTGFTTNEGSLYVNKAMFTSEEFTDFWRNLLPRLTEQDLETINSLYPDPTKTTNMRYYEDRLDQGVGKMYKRIEAAYAHYAYTAPVRQTAHFSSGVVPVYLYHWALERDAVNGARHGDNMFYEMRHVEYRGKSASLEELSGINHAYITSFICTGSPDGVPGRYGSRPSWPQYDNANPKVMVFGQANKELVGGQVGPPAELLDDEWAKEESDFWWSKVEISQQ
ncbi:acetylcholinesterase precursor [Thozetella sp. PMI_491]|nr:acetylcholinesterase precursor [Thozetella sp. PMI_491]